MQIYSLSTNGNLFELQQLHMCTLHQLHISNRENPHSVNFVFMHFSWTNRRSKSLLTSHVPSRIETFSTKTEDGQAISAVTWKGTNTQAGYTSYSVLKFVVSKSVSYKPTRVGTLIVATIYLQLIQNRYMFPSFTVLQCSHQHCVQPVSSDVEFVGYL